MNPRKPRKRDGQPKPRKNSTLTIRLLDHLRGRLEAEAKASGRSVSEQAAHLMSLALLLGNELDALKALADTQKNIDDNIKAAMHRRGWGKVVDPNYGGAIYIPPGQHALPRSGFMDPAEIEKKVEQAVERVLARGATLRIGGGSK